MRTRLLEARGWRVVAIPHFEWHRACLQNAQARYLWSKLPRDVAQELQESQAEIGI